MFAVIFHSEKTIKEKIDELKKIASHPDFLNILKDPGEFLEEFIPFANQVFREIPADNSMSFGPENEMRVFCIRLLTKFDYKGFNTHILLDMIYNLFATENIFNRYLTLKILFPLLDSDIFIDPVIHLKSINTFFKIELPSTENYDNSRCKLGFFSAAEALNYLKYFQMKFNLPTEAYEEILYSLTGAFKVYFVQKYIEEFFHNKKISCEFCSFGIYFFEFINKLNIPTSHYIMPFVPQLCYNLCNMCPRDCVVLQCEILDTIMSTFSNRKDLMFGFEKYFLKNAYLATDSPFLKIKNLNFLSILIKDFNRGMSKIVFSEFDARINEYIPIHKDIPLISACIEALTYNLISALKYPLEPLDLKILVVRHIKTANKIYRKLHLPNNCQYLEKQLPDKSPDESADLKFLSYLKVFVKALSTVQILKPVDWEDIIILGQLMLFPLTREISCFDYLSLFNEFPVDVLETIISPVIDEMMINFHSQVFSWSALMKIPEIFSLFIKAANILIHRDITTSRFHSIDFYRTIFPISYGFFKIDKRFAKPDCNELFSFIFDSFLRFNPSEYKMPVPFDTKMAIELVNSMFLDIKNCEIVYTGLYFIYDTFENTVNELYTLYAISFDSFYLECLFNIPVSLNLLITKYSILIPPMIAGLRSSKKLREIIMKYVEYIIEFDTEESGMENLLVTIYDLLQEHSLKGINVLSRISNKHRNSLNSGELKDHKLMNTKGICIKSLIRKSFENIENSFLEEDPIDKNEISDILRNALCMTDSNSKNLSDDFIYLNIPIDEIKRISIPALTGYEFYHENSIRRYMSCKSSSRILKGCGNNIEILENARVILIDYLLRLLKIENIFSGDKIQLLKTSGVLQSISDICFAFLLDSQDNSFDILNSICLKVPLDFLNEFLIDGLIYSFERTMLIIKSVINGRGNQDEFKKFVHSLIYNLIDHIYSADDLKSYRAFDALSCFLKSIPSFYLPECVSLIKDVLQSVFYKLKNCVSFRIYLIALSISTTLLDKIGSNFIHTLDKLFERLIKTQSPYLRALIFEIKAIYNVFMIPESLPEMNKYVFIRLFQYSKDSILKIENLSVLCESFLKSLNKKDNCSIKKFIEMLDKIRDDEALFSNILTPVKKYLPPVAVLEGFDSLESRRKFVENVNRNGNFQIQNPNSLKVFRNLFFDCKINGSIKSSVIEFINSSDNDHKIYLLEILMNCVEYDLPSFDFLITKLAELPLLNVSHILGLSQDCMAIFETLWSRITSQPDSVKEMLLIYLIERMNISFVYNFVEYCVPINSRISLVLTNFLNDFIHNSHPMRDQYAISKSAYNVLRYLKKKKCRFNDNKAILIVYKDLFGIELEIDDLVNWYFKNFSTDDIEFLFRINNGFLITSNFLISKLSAIESISTRNWMLNCLKKHLGASKYNCINNPFFIDPKYQEIIQKSSYLESSRLLDCNGFLYKCLSCYLKSKGLHIYEKADQKPIEIGKTPPESSFELENDSDDLHSFKLNGESIYSSSETDISLFIDDQSIHSNSSIDDNDNNNSEFKHVENIQNGNNLNYQSFNPISSHYNSYSINTNKPIHEFTSVPIEKAILKDTDRSQINKEEYYIVNLKDLAAILPLFQESINVIIELFCDLRIYSHDLVQFCMNTPQASYRFASLFYLSMFNPQPEFFDEIFKLNYQESKYVHNSLRLLIDKFGTKPFHEIVKTVLRSEMRFKTSEFILIPLLLVETEFFEDQEILFEVCVFTKRLLGKGTINYQLLNFLNSLSSVSNSFKEDINTQTILIEIAMKKPDLYYSSNYNRKIVQMTFDPKIFTLLENDLSKNKIIIRNNCPTENMKGLESKSQAKDSSKPEDVNSSDRSSCAEKERFIQLHEQKFTFNNGVFIKENPNGFDKNILIKIFLEAPGIILSKSTIHFLKLPFSTFLNSSLENQMTVLEIFIENDNESHHHEFNDLVPKFLNNLVLSKYPNLSRFSLVYPKLIKLFSSILEWLPPLIVDNEFVYPPLFEFLPEFFEVCNPEVAVSLCSKRPANISIDTIEFNILHLFKILPFSLDIFKLEFFNGLLSKNKFTRGAYLDFFLSHVPNSPYASLKFVFLFNFNGLEEFHSEYIIMAILYKSLVISNELILNFKLNTSGTSNYPLINLGHHSLMNQPPQISDLILLNKDSSSNVIPCYFNVVESLLNGFFNLLSEDNLMNLYKLFNENFNRSFRIKLPFYKAFISAGISISDFVFNPYSPSLKFYQLADRELYLGLVKSKGGLREIKNIVKSLEENDENETLDVIFEFFRKVIHRQASFNMEDIDFAENEVKRIYLGNGIPYFSIFKDKNLEISDKNKGFSYTSPCFNSSLHLITEVEQLEIKFKKVLEGLENEKNILDDVKSLVNSLSMMSFVPRNSLLFSKLLMFSTITSEIVESSIILKDNLTDSIFGRFRMWMNRHPSFLASFIDWNYFMKWRTFIFNKALNLVADNDKKKISTEICRLSCIYSSKAFKEKLYLRSSSILNEVSSLTTIEINQNMQRTLLDLENLFYLKEYNTMVSLINSLNIAKFSNEEKSRLYYWIYKALKKLGKNTDSERYGTLSRKLCEIIENKKDDLEIIKERLKFRANHEKSLIEENFSTSGFFSLFPSASNSELEGSYVNKLIEIINEVSIEESRTYMIELLKYSSTFTIPFDSISHRKLYFFIPQIKNIDFLLVKNPLLRSSIESMEIFANLYSNIHTRNCEDQNNSDNCDRDNFKNFNCKIANDILNELMVQKTPDVKKIKEIASNAIYNQIRKSFSCSFCSSSFFFQKDTVLPGEFSIIRSKYDDLKIMEYVEYCDSKLSDLHESFFVRNSDGSLYKIIAQERGDDYSQSSDYFQFYQFYSDVLNNFDLEKLGYKCSVIPTFKFSNGKNIHFSVHKNVDSPVEIMLKLQICKQHDDPSILYTDFFTGCLSNPPLISFCNSISKFKNTLRDQILDTVIDFNDFYIYKKNFINSYSSFLFIQYLLSLNNISLEDTFIDRNGNCYVTALSSRKEKIYLRPNFQSIFGSEGINGVLYRIFSEFLTLYNSEIAIDSFIFFGMGTINDFKKKMNFSNLSKDENFVNLIISESIDPKTGIYLPKSDCPWL